MSTQSAQFDLASAYLDIPTPLCYGLVRGQGNQVFQQELANKTRVAIYRLGTGPWDSLLRIWINRILIPLPDLTKVHFHPGLDGEIGFGMAAGSTGGDQHVDAFWTDAGGGFTAVTYSACAYLMLKVPPDPGAPSADLEVLADYQAMKCRIFNNAGAQTFFQWTQNPAWWICDFLIRKFVLREGKANQPLVAAELAQFDWQSFVDAAAYFDADIGGGIKRFSDGGLVFIADGLTADRALEQILLLCRSYLRRRKGKFTLYADQPRASVFTFGSDDIAASSLTVRKSSVRTGKNQLTAKWREVSMGTGGDDTSRMTPVSNAFNHRAHQRTIGGRGVGLSPIPKVQTIELDFGNNTGERVARLAQFQLVRQLGDDTEAEAGYLAPFEAEWRGYRNALKVEPGDVITLHSSLSEEFGGKLFEVMEIEDFPNGERQMRGLEYMPNAFTDVAPAQQLIEAPSPGTGLTMPNGVEMVRNPILEFGDNGWTKETGFSIVSDSANAYSGSWAAKFVGIVAGALRNAILIAVQPGDVLLATCMIKRTAGDGSPAVRISWLAANGLTELAVSPGNAITSVTYGTSRVVAAAPASAFFGRVEGIVAGATVSTTAFFDQFNATLFPKTVDDIADGTGSPLAGGKRGFAAIDAGNQIAGGANIKAGLVPGRMTSTSPLSNTGFDCVISIAARTFQFVQATVNYNSGSVTVSSPCSNAIYHIYADDPTYAGGAVTYVATLNEYTAMAGNGRVYFGVIQILGGTPATGVGGGMGGPKTA